MSGTHAERPVSGLCLTELEKLDGSTINAFGNERFLRVFAGFQAFRDDRSSTRRWYFVRNA